MLYPVAKIIQYSVQVLLLQLFAAKRKAKSANIKVVEMNLIYEVSYDWASMTHHISAQGKVQLYGFVAATACILGGLTKQQ